MVPFTTYYFSKIKLVINDSPYSLSGLFDQSKRTQEFVTYKWHRSGFDAVEGYYSEELKKKNGEMLEQFLIYIDKGGVSKTRNVLTFWDVIGMYGGLSRSMLILGGFLFTLFG